METELNNTIEEIKTVTEDLLGEIDKTSNKSSSRRSRKRTSTLTNLFKKFRKLSVENDKK